MPTIVEKRCRVCGMDVSQRKRTKDGNGNYYCDPCYQSAAQASHPAEDEVAPVVRLPSRQGAARTGDVAPVGAADVTPEPSWRLGKGEIGIIAAGVTVGLFLIGTLVYVLFVRDVWENQNREGLMSLKSSAQLLSGKGQLEEASAKYDELFHLLGEHKVRNTSLQASLQDARDAAAKIASEMSVRREAELAAQRQQEGQWRLAQEQAEKERQALARRAAEKEEAEKQAAADAAVRQAAAEAAAKTAAEKAEAERLAADAKAEELGRAVLVPIDQAFKWGLQASMCTPEYGKRVDGALNILNKDLFPRNVSEHTIKSITLNDKGVATIWILAKYANRSGTPLQKEFFVEAENVDGNWLIKFSAFSE
jgi:hypothetical protein